MENQEILPADYAPLPDTHKITPYDYQRTAYWKIAEAIRNYQGPIFLEASVGAGKTIMMGMVLARAQAAGMTAWTLARRGELVEQNAETFWECGVKNSIYSASCDVKSTHYPMLVGSEGTAARSMGGELRSQSPDILLIDECFTGDTLIRTGEGLRRISDLVGTNPRIFCVDEESGSIRLDSAVRVFSNGIRNVSRIETTEGAIRCTPTHRIYASGSWVEAKYLKPGRKITIDGSRDFVLKKLLRAFAAVAKRLCQGIFTGEK